MAEQSVATDTVRTVVVEVISEVLVKPIDGISITAKMGEDLEADSLEVAEMLIEIEGRLGCEPGSLDAVDFGRFEDFTVAVFVERISAHLKG